MTAESDTVYIEYFHKPKCKECGQYVNSEGFDALINRLKDEYGNQIYINWLDVNHEEIRERLKEYNITLTPAVVFNGEYRLVRGEITMESLRETVDTLLDPSQKPPPMGGLATLSLSLIIISGLVDGFNPCAFSLLVFFISFLVSLKRSRRNILWMGLAYITGLFAVYIALGLGLLQAVSIFGVEHPFGILGAALLVILGALNLRDAFSYEESLLKFPKKAVPTVRRLMDKGVIPAALVLGGFVSMCEFACSGGVYVGILVLLSTSARFWEGLGYLFLYNVVFVSPLIAVLLLGSHADTLARIDRWRVVRRRQMKAIGGIFMILLGIASYVWVYL
ncbi:MAG: cytochrome c biogenesis protein [Candidatus Bathyarchaeota archaeon]